MSDVAELEKRITAALDRIGTGLDALVKPVQGDTDTVAALNELLETEKTANSQLEQRVSAIKEKQEQLVAGLERDVTRLRAELASRDGEMHKVKRVNSRLRENNRALRDANKQGVGDPALINDGMVVELDALRVAQSTDRAELDAILSDLKPLVQGGANA